MYKKRKYLYALFAFMIAALICIPQALQMRTQAASKPGTVKLSSIKATDYNKINIKWKKTSGATNYIVYYKKAGASKWTKVKTLDNKKTSYTHTSSKKYPIMVGQKYQYTVKAYNKKTKKSGSYNKKGLIANTIPQTVTGMAATFNDEVDPTVTISWKPAKGATSYVVYFRTKDNTQWLRLGTTKSLSYTDEGPYRGYNNAYTVRSYGNGVYGKYDTKGVSVYVPNEETDTPEPTVKPQPTEAPKPTVKPQPTEAPKPTVKPQPTEAPKPTTKPQPTEAPKPTTKPQPTATPKPTATPTPNPIHRADAAEINQMVQEVIRLTNIERAKVGSAPLQYHEGLQKAAMVRAKEISISFSHTRPDGRKLSTALDEAGVGGSSGENIAAVFRTPADVVEGWMNSQGHQVTMLSSRSAYIGVGIYQDEKGIYYWVQDFASEKANDKCTLTADANGGVFPDGSNVYSAQFPYQSHVTLSKDMPQPTRDGYKFAGWQSGRFTLSGLNITLNTTIKAIWEPIN